MKKRSFLRVPLFMAMGSLMVMSMGACSDNDNNLGDYVQESALKPIIEAYVDNTIIPTYKGLADATIELYSACLAMKTSGVGSITDSQVEAACTAWKKARKFWEMSEAWLYGAAADYYIDPHIDSWPLEITQMRTLLANTAQMNQMDDDGNYVGNYLGYGLLGFHAIEYMIFNVNENANGEYDGTIHDKSSYTEQELKYLTGVAGDLRNQCIRLEASWAGIDNVTSAKQEILEDNELEPTKNYGDQMKNAGNAGSEYKNYLEAAQTLIVGAQDIADEVGGLKIGNPTNHSSSGTAGYDPSYIESPYSLNSIEDFQDNIVSIQNAYMGYQGNRSGDNNTYVSTYLSSTNSTLSSYVATLDADLDSRVQSALSDAIAKIGLIEEPFATTAAKATTDDSVDAIIEAAIAACDNITDVLDEVNELLTANH